MGLTETKQWTEKKRRTETKQPNEHHASSTSRHHDDAGSAFPELIEGDASAHGATGLPQ
jgi:hypothetical protein